MGETFSNRGDCLVGKRIVAISRKIEKFKARSIIPGNHTHYKIKRLGGKKPDCHIDSSYVGQTPHMSSSLRCHYSAGDSLEANEIICECKGGEPLRTGKKISHFSASHSATGFTFFGSPTIAIVTTQFTQSSTISMSETISWEDIAPQQGVSPHKTDDSR